MDYGTNLKLARKWANLTQKDLAKKANIAAITIHQYEAGKRKPSVENWFAIANALHLSIDELNNAEMLPVGPFNPEIIQDELYLESAKGAREAKRILLTAFDQLNDEGQSKALERIEELTEIPRYKKEPSQG